LQKEIWYEVAQEDDDVLQGNWSDHLGQRGRRSLRRVMMIYVDILDVVIFIDAI
jgi:hypothetical protein